MLNTTLFAKKIRLRVLELCHAKRTSHIGGSFSIADILAVLYSNILNIKPGEPKDRNRDRLFYSKGHASTALYSALEIKGFFPDVDLLTSFTADETYFTAHINHLVPGVELSTGSLGHALGVACGSALALKKRRIKSTVFTILSDGELDEGSNWEAILFAAHNKLDNLIAIIDYNKIQSFGKVIDVINLEPLKDKFTAFNWSVKEVDGHSIKELQDVFERFKEDRSGKPKCIIAHTIKGKGVSFMENELLWHYRSPSDEDFMRAKLELETNNA